MMVKINLGYEVVKVTDSKSKIRDLLDNYEHKKVCEFNAADIYYTKNKKAVIIPQEGVYAIIYSDIEKLNKHIIERSFPISELETNSIIEKEKECIEDINMYIYINYIKDKYHSKIDLNNIENTITNLNNVINKQNRDLSDYDLLSIGIYLSHLFSIENDTEWFLDTVFTLNTYWYPLQVSNDKQKYDLIGNIFKNYKNHGFIDLLYSYRVEKAKILGIKDILSDKYLLYTTKGIIRE